MIVWVNGAFGSGKSTLVDELHRRRPEAVPFDPELIGQVLTESVQSPTGDFQDLRLWRHHVTNWAVSLVEEYRRPVLVPMTLIDPAYVDEIFGGFEKAGVTLHHFFLKVSPDTLAKRIDNRSFHPDAPEQDARVRTWCKSRIEQCTAAAATLPGSTVFLDGESTVQALADEVMDRIDTSEGSA